MLQAVEQYVEKCSNDEVKAKLGRLTQEEIREKLEKHMNPAEMEDYEKIVAKVSYYKDLSEKYSEDKEFFQDLSNIFAEKQFQYEKRIFQGHKPHVPKPVDYDLSDYNGDEETQINAQKEIEFTEEEQESLRSYFGSGYSELNKKLYEGEELDDNKGALFYGGSQSLAEKSKNLSTAIRKTTLEENTIVYHGGGHFNPSLVVGDTIELKGFTSCTYQKKVADDFRLDFEYTYKIALPKGSHGFCANTPMSDGETLTNHYDEHELLLDKGFKGKIANIDYENHEVTIIPA